MCFCLFVFCKSYILFIIVLLQADFKYFFKILSEITVLYDHSERLAIY